MALTMRHIISILLQNEAGALARAAALFSTRGYNIESLNVAPTEHAEISRLTLVTSGSDEVIDQINKQLLKLVDVVKTADWIIDLGPEGGDEGGTVVAAGKPEDIVKNTKSYTAKFLKAKLEAEK